MTETERTHIRHWEGCIDGMSATIIFDLRKPFSQLNSESAFVNGLNTKDYSFHTVSIPALGHLTRPTQTGFSKGTFPSTVDACLGVDWYISHLIPDWNTRRVMLKTSYIDRILDMSHTSNVFSGDGNALAIDCACHDISTENHTEEEMRLALLLHIFSGECASHQHAPGCQLIGLCAMSRNVDETAEYIITHANSMTDDQLPLPNLRSICKALGIDDREKVSRSHYQSALNDYLRTIEQADDTTVYDLAIIEESTPDELRSIQLAHGIETEDSYPETVKNAIFHHLCHGDCAKTSASRPVTSGCHAVRSLIDSTSNVLDNYVSRNTNSAGNNGARLQFGAKTFILQTGLRRSTQSSLLRLASVLHFPSRIGLKNQLRRYIQTIKKDSSSADETQRIEEHAQEDSKHEWPSKIGEQTKNNLIQLFRDSTGQRALQSFVCASCSERRIAKTDRNVLKRTDFDTTLLSRPGAAGLMSDWTSMDDVTSKFFVEREGLLHQGPEVVLQVCSDCFNDLTKRQRIPALGLANGLDIGRVPPELKDLTIVEEMLISRARAKCVIVQLKPVKLKEKEEEEGEEENQPNVPSGRGKSPRLPGLQKALRGHVIVFPQDHVRTASMLPPTIEEVTTYICIVFVGSSRPTDEWIRKKAEPMYVRREKVRAALRWLKANNPLYRDIYLHEGRIEDLPENGTLPYFVHHQTNEHADDMTTASYDPVRHQPYNETPQETRAIFESVIITDIEQDASTNELKAAALRHLAMPKKRFVDIPHGPAPVNEFQNPELFPMMFPTLFPYGRGGFDDRLRPTPLSFPRQIRHYLCLSDRRFQTHNIFMFTAFNMVQRHHSLRYTKFLVSLPKFQRVANVIANTPIDAITSVANRLASGDSVTAYSGEERSVLTLMKEVRMITMNIPGSAHSRIRMRNELRGLMITLGMPSYYVTINPADTQNPLVRFLAGEEIDVDNLVPGNIPSDMSQSILIAKNPVVAATFFNIIMKAFLRTLLGFRPEKDDESTRDGVLGKGVAYYGCVEAQGRGSLHCHLLIWVAGSLNPNEIRDKIVKDPNSQFVKDLVEMLDDVISTEIPAPADLACKLEKPSIHPCNTRGISLSGDGTENNRKNDMYYLVKTCQWHRHNSSCYKYWKGPPHPKECRYNLGTHNVQKNTSVDPETGEITLRRLNGRINNYNNTILEALRCNMDIKFIGSGQSAKAILYYITDYISKSQLKTHIAYGALELAVRKLDALMGLEDDETRAKRLLQKCAYAIVSHQELSGQQVASYLMGYEDHFTSHRFRPLWWASFEAVINRISPDKDRIELQSVKSQPAGSDNPEDNCYDNQQTDENAVFDDDDVMIENREGELAPRAGSVADYVFRPTEFEQLPVWDFIARTNKLPGSKKKKDQGKWSRWGLREPHIEASSHWITWHEPSSYRVPVPSGPGLPRRDRPDLYERYCRLMLVLFKPWRRISDLKTSDQSWVSSFEEFNGNCEERFKYIMNNMQLLHECRDSRDDHFAQRRSGQRTFVADSAWLVDVDREAEDTNPNETQEDILSHLHSIDKSRSLLKSRSRTDAEACVAAAQTAGLFDYAHMPSRPFGSAHELIQTGNKHVEFDWKVAYEGIKEERKKRDKDAADARGAGTEAELPGTVFRYYENSFRDTAVLKRHKKKATTLADSIEEISDEFSLNQEQSRAFRMIAKQAKDKAPEPLRMYIGGSGGTGKSRVLLAVREFFRRRQESHRLRIASYTGVAAHNIKGTTLHQALSLGQRNGRQKNSRSLHELIANWEAVDFLFIDEVSMIGCQFLLSIHQQLVRAKSSPEPYGGINIIFAGDFAQLPPVGQTRLFSRLNTRIAASSGTSTGQQNIQGKLLWLHVQKVVMLRRPMRQIGEENRAFVALLERLRVGKCTEEDYSLLQTRINPISTQSPDESWSDVPLIVGDNASKDLLNERAAEAFSRATGRPLGWYYAADYHKGDLITDNELTDEIATYHSGMTGYRLTRLPMVEGMPVVLSLNYDVENGIVNGTFGKLKQVRYIINEADRKEAKSCVVECPAYEGRALPHLADQEIAVLEDAVDMVFVHPHSGKRCALKRHQLPIFPAFAITVYKSQGLTFPKAIVDLQSCRTIEAAYVMISRVRSLAGLTILRPFSKSKINSRLSEDSRKEFARLDALDAQTTIAESAEEDPHQPSRDDPMIDLPPIHLPRSIKESARVLHGYQTALLEQLHD